MTDLYVFIGFMVIIYLIGSSIEKKHYARIIEREKRIHAQPVLCDDFVTPDQKIAKVKFVGGSCVIAADRFKVWLGGLRSIFGGNVGAYESLLDRSRRESILRMRAKAPDADMIVQTRLTMSQLGPGMVEILVYGTAVYLKR